MRELSRRTWNHGRGDARDAGARAFAPPGGWRSGFGSETATLFACASAVSILMSTQFLFQPFVWRNWSVADIAPAWLSIARDRLTVGLTIAAGLSIAARVAALRGPWRLCLQTLAVVAGAAIGEGLLWLWAPYNDRQDLLSILGRVARWSLIGGAVATMVELWRAGEKLAAEAEEAHIQDSRMQQLTASTELEMLQRQIEPHFLFNTLATIRRLQETDPSRGQHLLGRLLQYLSATLASDPTCRSSLGKEVSLVCAYLDVCASRMGGRLTVCCDVPAELESVDFPPLVLATLAENAMKHGIFPRDRGSILIDAVRVGDLVEVAVSDDGAGLSSESGSGLGLANIAARLRLLYSGKAELRLRPNAPSGVRACVRIPAAPASA